MMGSPDSPNEQGFVDMHYYALKKRKDDKTNYRTLNSYMFSLVKLIMDDFTE